MELNRPYFMARNDEGIDRVELVVEDRFKQSELSGDEWRYSVLIQFYRKGVLLGTKRYSRMEWAVSALPYEFMVFPEQSPMALWRLDSQTCAQYGCAKEAVVTYQTKKRYSERGEGPLPEGAPVLRSYCEKHKNRGDSDLEDSMQNLVVVPKEES
jgi:hypothetical protein